MKAPDLSAYADLDLDARRDSCHFDEPPSADEQMRDFFAEFFAHSLAVQDRVYRDLSPYLQSAIDAERAMCKRVGIAAVRETTDEWRAAQEGRVA
jgi:hypothetical protein